MADETTTPGEVLKKKRIRKTLEERLSEKEEKIQQLKAQAALLKRKQSAQRRKARARVLIKLGARWAAANKIEDVEHFDPSTVPDAAFLPKHEDPDPVDARRGVFIKKVGVNILIRCGIDSNAKADAMSDEEQEKFLRFLSKICPSIFRYKNWTDGEVASYWAYWDDAWQSFCTYSEDVFFERKKGEKE